MIHIWFCKKNKNNTAPPQRSDSLPDLSPVKVRHEARRLPGAQMASWHRGAAARSCRQPLVDHWNGNPISNGGFHGKIIYQWRAFMQNHDDLSSTYGWRLWKWRFFIRKQWEILYKFCIKWGLNGESLNQMDLNGVIFQPWLNTGAKD